LYFKNGRIGVYTKDEREGILRRFVFTFVCLTSFSHSNPHISCRFKAKRGRRVWKRKVRYKCRKKLAEGRPRVKGRFVKMEKKGGETKQEEEEKEEEEKESGGMMSGGMMSGRPPVHPNSLPMPNLPLPPHPSISYLVSINDQRDDRIESGERPFKRIRRHSVF